MAIKFRCSECGTRIEVDDSKAGRRLRCRNEDCDEVLVVPKPNSPGNTGEDEDEEPRKRESRGRRRKEGDEEEVPRRRRRKGGNLRSSKGGGARNIVFGVLFCLLGTLMLIGGLTADEIRFKIGGPILGGSLIFTGVLYFMGKFSRG